jgi:hypothetical protein
VIRVALAGIGIAAPGLPDWEAARAVLAGAVRYAPAPLAQRVPGALPAAERRRAGAATRLALAVAQEAVARAGADAASVASVFASADSDAENVHQICLALAGPRPEISPTRFHNSVQNAASGYWSIATGARAPTTTVNGLATVFGGALLEAAVQAALEARAVLLVAYDLPPPPPLQALHPISEPVSAALLLAPPPAAGALATLELALVPGAADSALADPALERLRLANPAARALPLLAAVARREHARIVLALDEANALEVAVRAGRAGRAPAAAGQ